MYKSHWFVHRFYFEISLTVIFFSKLTTTFLNGRLSNWFSELHITYFVHKFHISYFININNFTVIKQPPENNYCITE